MIKKKIVLILSLIAVAVLLLQGKALLKKRQEEIATQPIPVADTVTVPVVTPKEGVMNQEIAFLAQIFSDKAITLSTKIPAYIEHVRVQETQEVKQDEVLVDIDETELRLNINALKATLLAQQNDTALAKSIYHRNMKLYHIGGLSKEQLEVSHVLLQMKQSVMENTKQKIAQLEHQLTYLKIVAPFDGCIDAVLMHEGDLASTGKAILSMSNGAKKLLFSYAPREKNRIKKGQMVVSGEEKIGTIRAIYTTSNNGLITAEVALDRPVGLPVGSSMQIKVLTQSQTGCILPDTTVVHQKEGTFVMVYQEGKFTPFAVTVVMHEGNHLMVAPCPEGKVASASEVKLASLPVYEKVKIIGAEDE